MLCKLLGLFFVVLVIESANIVQAKDSEGFVSDWLLTTKFNNDFTASDFTPMNKVLQLADSGATTCSVEPGCGTVIKDPGCSATCYAPKKAYCACAECGFMAYCQVCECR